MHLNRGIVNNDKPSFTGVLPKFFQRTELLSTQRGELGSSPAEGGASLHRLTFGIKYLTTRFLLTFPHHSVILSYTFYKEPEVIPRYTRPEMGKIWTDQRKFETWLQIELLACEALSQLGQIPAEALREIKQKASFDTHRINEIEKVTKHDVLAFLTNVGESVGPLSSYLHYGLTSSDILDTSLGLLLKEASELILQDIGRLLEVLKNKAFQYKETLMIGRSHGIHAEPITFGLKMTVWYDEMKRNLIRMERAKEAVSVGKLSGAVGTFAHIPPSVEKYVC